MKKMYLAFTILGAVVPYYFFFQHFAASGVGPGDFISAVFANPAASGFASDLLITSCLFWIVRFRERARGRGPSPGVFIVLNPLVGLSCAVPAYLYVRTDS